MRSAVLGLMIFATACHSGRPVTPAPPPPPDIAAGPALAMPSDDVLAYLPADAGFVASFDVKRIMASTATETPQSFRAVATGLLTQACGTDPLADLASVVIAGDMEGEAGRGVAVLRGVARDAALDCARRTGSNGTAQVTPDSIVVSSESGLVQMALFVDATTVVVSNRSTDTIASLRALVESGAPLRTSPAFTSAWDGLPHRAPIEFLLNGPSALAASAFSTRFPHPTVVVGTIAVDDTVALHAVATMASEGDAKDFHAKALAVVRSARNTFGTFRLDVQGTAVTIEGTLSAAQASAWQAIVLQ